MDYDEKLKPADGQEPVEEPIEDKVGAFGGNLPEVQQEETRQSSNDAVHDAIDDSVSESLPELGLAGTPDTPDEPPVPESEAEVPSQDTEPELEPEPEPEAVEPPVMVEVYCPCTDQARVTMPLSDIACPNTNWVPDMHCMKCGQVVVIKMDKLTRGQLK